MDYSQNYFGKPLNDLALSDIENYFTDAKEETETIEFKSFVGKELQGSQYDPILMAVCALLNSSGGIVIWGAPVGKKENGKKEKVFQGALSPLNIILEKDALISKISSKITPMPKGINVEIIKEVSNCVCVFEIQKSQYSPHQIDNRYYMRLDGQSVIAPHYFIEAMFRQVKYPDIGGYLKLLRAEYSGSNFFYHLYVEALIWNWSALQNETNVHLSLDTDVGHIAGYGFQNTDPNPPVYWNDGQSVKYKNAIEVLHYGSPLSKHIKLEIPSHQIRGEINLALYFGGKKSPQKVSQYKCRISIPSGLNDPLKCEILEMKENIFMHEHPDAMISKEEKLRQALGR
jgi:hypothetical protein